MCRALGLLQDEAPFSGAAEAATDSFARAASPVESPVHTRQGHHRHRLVGGMDVLQQSNPHITDVLQVCGFTYV